MLKVITEEQAFIISAKVLRGPTYWGGGGISKDHTLELFLFKNKF
jgi:hypothetical protein